MGSSQVASTNSDCTGCSAASLGKSVDNDKDSAAEIMFSAAGGQLTVRATTQSGTVVNSNQKAGALISYPASLAATNSLSFTTYLGGQMQESGGGFINGADNSTSSTPNFYRFPTAKPYDSIVATFTRRGTSDTSAVKLYEFCSE